MSLTVKGQKELMKKLRAVSNAPKIFDPVYKKASLKALRGYVEHTKRDSGDTARAWKIKRDSDSFYIVYNDKTTGSKIPIVQIIDQGRKTVVPRRAKFLYIPLTEKGKAKDASAVFGVDFVLAKKSRAVKGTKFIKKVSKEVEGNLAKDLLRRYNEVWNRG